MIDGVPVGPAPGSLLETGLRHVAESVKAIPEGKTGALVAIFDSSGARLGGAVLLGEHWRMAGEVELKARTITPRLVIECTW